MAPPKEASASSTSSLLPPLTFSEHATAVAVLGTLCTMFYIVPAVCLAVAFELLRTGGRSVAGWTAAAVLVGLAVMPSDTRPELRKHHVLKVVNKYFGFRWVDDAGKGRADMKDDKRDKSFMMVWFPHGIIPLAPFCASAEWDERLPNYFGRMAVAPALIRVPILRSVFTAFGAMPNDKKSIVRALKKQEHVSLFPGGIAEIFLSSRKEERLYLKGRKGFVKIALQTGAHIIPVYVFGHSQMFDQSSNSGFVAKLSRAMRASVALIWGRWGLPVPYRTPVTFVRGTPIFVDQTDDPTTEQIEALHARVVKEVEVLYYRHRDQAGSAYKDKPLIVE